MHIYTWRDNWIHPGLSSLAVEPDSATAVVLTKAESCSSVQMCTISLLPHYVTLLVLHKSGLRGRLLMELSTPFLSYGLLQLVKQCSLILSFIFKFSSTPAVGQISHP